MVKKDISFYHNFGSEDPSDELSADELADMPESLKGYASSLEAKNNSSQLTETNLNQTPPNSLSILTPANEAQRSLMLATPRLKRANDVSVAIAEANEYLQSFADSYFPRAGAIKGIYKRSCRSAFGLEAPARVKDLYSILVSDRFIISCYDKLKSNKGTTTPGPGGDSGDSTNIDKIKDLVKKLKTKTFKWSPVKRVHIPKPYRPKDPTTGLYPTRPLGIPEFDDRLVQEGIRVLLNAIYEPQFEALDCNFGSRPYKSVRDAIDKLFFTGKSMLFAIEGDIVGAFNYVDPKILKTILEKSIDDKDFIKLCIDCFKAGLIEDGVFRSTSLGTPQGGIHSPTLFTIYMHEFDQFVMNTIKPFVESQVKDNSTEKIPSEWQNHPKYGNFTPLEITKRIRALQQRINRIKKQQAENVTPTPSQIAGADEAAHDLEILSKIRAGFSAAPRSSSKTCRMTYVRYVDDFIILVDGPRTLCETVKSMIAEYLKTNLGLELSLEKTKITSFAKDEKARFLGFEFRRKLNKRMSKLTVINPLRQELSAKGVKSMYSEPSSNTPAFPQDFGHILINGPYEKKKKNYDMPPGQTGLLSTTNDLAPSEGAISVYSARPNTNLIISIDQDRYNTRWVFKRFISSKALRPRENPPLSVLSVQEIITFYNQVMLGFCNYFYPNLTYKNHLNIWIYRLYYSCLKTLSTKLRITIAAIIKKYGFKEISNPSNVWKRRDELPAYDQRIVYFWEENTELISGTVKKSLKYVVLYNYREIMARQRAILYDQKIVKGLNNLLNDYDTLPKRVFRTEFKITKFCIVCGSTGPIQMHHVRHVRKGGKSQDGFTQIMNLLNRKQLPLCPTCHTNVHAGRYNDIKLSDLYDARLANVESKIILPGSWNDPSTKPGYQSKLLKNRFLPDPKSQEYKALLEKGLGRLDYEIDRDLRTIKSKYIVWIEQLSGQTK
jgi:retron-type reverse transcriptase